MLCYYLINMLSAKSHRKLFLVALLIAVMVFPIVYTRQVLAASGAWVDIAHIKVGNDIYFDSDPYDSNINFRINGDQGSCVNTIDGFSTSDIFDQSKLGSATITFRSLATGGGCLPTGSETITLSAVANADIQFYWIDAAQLQGAVSGKIWTRTTTTSPSGNEIFELNGGGGGCTGIVEVTSSTTANFCRGDTTTLGNSANRSIAAGTGTIGGNPATGGTTAIVEENCENSVAAQDEKLRWLSCAIITGLDGMINWLDDRIQEVLLVQDPASTSFKANSELHTAWGRMRNIALIILIPIMLVMVIGTALGVSFLDAYTVRRAMPRFLIAIVFISISWYITSFLINLTNAVGTGVLGLITNPFGGPNLGLKELLTPVGAGVTTYGSIAVLGALFINGTITIPIILSTAAVAGVIMAIGYFLLVIRQMIILVSVLFAPLAILSWIFPNNDKLWKLWWGTFSKLLMMFPLMMILFGAGKIFAFVIAGVR